RRAGLHWDNPRGLRRVVVRNADFAPAAPAAAPAPAPAAALTPAPAVQRRTARSTRAERGIDRNDMVLVVFDVGGVRLTVPGRAASHAAVGEQVAVTNLQSGRTIPALATGPGRAVAGPRARQASADLQIAAR